MNYVIFDLEATCWDNNSSEGLGKENEIIEIGAVKLNENLEEVGQLQVFVKPKTTPILSDFCKQLTHITQEQVDGDVTFQEAYEKFIAWGGQDSLYASWGFYDEKQLRQDCKLHGMPQRKLKHVSIKHEHQKIENLPKALGLGRALKHEKMVFEGTPHRGIDDAINITKIFKKHFNKITGKK